MSLNSKFSSDLYQYRSRNRLTQQQMADICGISTRQYQELEIGRSLPSLPTAVYIANALDMSLDSLKDEL